jgi:hypothetical protein
MDGKRAAFIRHVSDFFSERIVVQPSRFGGNPTSLIFFRSPCSRQGVEGNRVNLDADQGGAANIFTDRRAADDC